MADEYIKRSDVLDNIAIGRTVYPDCKKAFDGMEVEVNRFPTEDVQPVVHGKWLWEYADNGWANHICSVCGYTKNTDIHVVMDYNFCPNCGARMDGGT